MEGYRLLRKNRQARREEAVALYVGYQLECMQHHVGMEEEPNENFWVRIKGRAGTGDIIVGICYRPPNQETERTRPFIGRQEQPHVHKSWSSRRTSATPISVGGATQQGINNPSGSWNTLMISSFSK